VISQILKKSQQKSKPKYNTETIPPTKFTIWESTQILSLDSERPEREGNED
jgi:hypothetical protein